MTYKLEPVRLEDVPAHSARKKGACIEVVDAFYKSGMAYAKVTFEDMGSTTLRGRMSGMYLAIKRRGYPIKATQRGTDIFLVRTK